MNETLQAIVDLFKRGDPEDADFYTVEWVSDECAFLNKSPEDYLAELRQFQARIAAIIEAAPEAKDHPRPAHYAMKFGGPIDALSYKLMKESGELAILDAAYDGEEKWEEAKSRAKLFHRHGSRIRP